MCSSVEETYNYFFKAFRAFLKAYFKSLSFRLFEYEKPVYFLKDPPPPVFPKNTSWYKVA